MDLSIIIITLNNKNILEECVRSIKQYTKNISFEIIVSDNGSSDGTQNRVKELFPEVKLIANKKNLGFSRANNNGLNIAEGRYALVLNDDTYIKSDAFSPIIKFMDENSDVGICGPKLLNIDGSTQRQGSILSLFKWSSDRAIDVSLVIGACMFLKRSMLDKIGLFDDNLFFYNDDLDICKRAIKAGYKVKYFPMSQVYHYGGFSSKKHTSLILQVEGYRGGLYYCRKHYGPVIYQAYRLILLVCALILLPFSLMSGQKLEAHINMINILLKQQLISNP